MSEIILAALRNDPEMLASIYLLEMNMERKDRMLLASALNRAYELGRQNCPSETGIAPPVYIEFPPKPGESIYAE